MHSQNFTNIDLKKKFENLTANYGLSKKIKLSEHTQNNKTLDNKSLPLAPLNLKSELAQKIQLNKLHQSKEYYQELFEERAGILEFDAGFPRAEAENIAYLEVTKIWITNESSISGKLPKAINSSKDFLSDIKPDRNK